MVRKKTLFAILLSTLILSSCGGVSEESGINADVENDLNSQIAVADSQETDMNYASIMNMQVINNCTYYYTYKKDEETGSFQLECCRQSGENDADVIYTYGDAVVMKASRVDEQGNWYNLYVNTELDQDVFFLEKLDAEGESLYLMMTDTFGDILIQEEVHDSSLTLDGRFCVLTGKGSLLFWDIQGKEQGKLKNVLDGDTMKRWENGLVNAGSSGVYLYNCMENTVELQELHCDSASLGSKQEIKITASSETTGQVFKDSTARVKVYSGYENGIYLAGTDKLWKYSPEGDLTELLNWNDPYVNLKPDFVEQIYEEGSKLIFLCYDVFQGTSSRVEVAQKEASQIKEKITIVLGAINDFISKDNLTPVIQKYNEQSDEFHVELKLYGSETGKKSEAIEEMNRDLLQGKGPDLFELSRHSIPNLISQGVLEDMRPYFESSDQVKEEDIVASVLQVLGTEGKLYAITPSFSIRCLISLSGYSTDGGMSTQQCMKLAEDNPESVLKMYASQYSMLDLLISADMDHFINWQDGTCAFNNEEFIHILDTVSKWKADTGNMDLNTGIKDAEALYDKQALLTFGNIGSMVNYLQIKNAFEDFASISGWPNKEGEAKYQFNFGSLFGIVSDSQHKDGAWDFMEYLLSDSYQKSLVDTGLPVVKNYFEEALTKGMDQGALYMNSYTGEADKDLVPALEDQEAVRRIADSIYYDQLRTGAVNDILLEETAPVFNGSKTAQEAAEIIQSRISMYLKE